MKIKICGLTRVEDARLAAELGAWGIGFIFAPASHRFISFAKAGEIIRALPQAVEKVGVFVDATPELVEEARAVGITIAQLHGDESPETARRIGGRIIRAVRRPDAGLAGYPAEAFLIDGPRAGAPADWAFAREAKKLGEVFLAGGVGVENARRAVREVAPHGLDLSSSVESAPGVKDHAKLKRFFEEVTGL